MSTMEVIQIIASTLALVAYAGICIGLFCGIAKMVCRLISD